METKPFTPEQLKAAGKSLGSLNRDTAVSWLAQAQHLPSGQKGLYCRGFVQYS